MYDYKEVRKELLAEADLNTLSRVRKRVNFLLTLKSSFSYVDIHLVGDSWLILASLDFMIEEGILKKVGDNYENVCNIWL